MILFTRGTHVTIPLIVTLGSMMDVAAIFVLRLRAAWVAKTAVFVIPGVGWLMGLAEYIPVMSLEPRHQLHVAQNGRARVGPPHNHHPDIPGKTKEQDVDQTDVQLVQDRGQRRMVAHHIPAGLVVSIYLWSLSIQLLVPSSLVTVIPLAMQSCVLPGNS